MSMDHESGNQPAHVPVTQMHGVALSVDLDFNESANPLWSHYGKMAKEDDKDTLEDMTSGMEGLLLFVRSLPPL